MTTKEFRDFQSSVPKEPGVYRFIKENGTVLYVGKAKNLRNRLSSYFGEKKDMPFKTKSMVRNAHHIEFTIVHSEQDALLLESTLIKKLQPKYNVMLKDGKNYSYICIKKERFPRVFFTRKRYKDGSTYFGPYTSKVKTRVITEIIKKIFPLRTCKLNLSEKYIDAGKYNVCLEYHIKNCMGPCEGLESEEEYNEKINQIKNILRGNFKQVKAYIHEEMERLADHLEFEKAQEMKEKLDALNDYQAKSTVISNSFNDLDVFSITSDEKMAYVNYLQVVNGVVILADTVELVKNLDIDERDLLNYIIPVIREKFESNNTEIIVPFEVDIVDENIKLTIPQRGEKRSLLEMSQKNVKFFLLDRKRKKAEKQTPAERILKTLKKDLDMEEIPFHIECFDNSNIQGTNPTSSCVVFKNAKPSKKDYRHFNVKTVEGPNDFASMEEVVYRRYKRLLDEGASLPQLVIIDGGKGQLSSSMISIDKLGLRNKITVVGIAKRLEEIFFPDDPVPLYINKKSESLKLMQQARDEAHRFALRHHRNRRSNDFLGTALTDINGVGEKTANKLLTTFKSVKNIKKQSLESLSSVVGNSVATKIIQHFEEE